MMESKLHLPNRISLVLLNSFIVLTIFSTILILFGFNEASVRMNIRATARTSLFFFLMAFFASSFTKVFKSEFTRWLLRNRRYFGLSFAISHLIHLIFILILNHQMQGELFGSYPAQIFLGGGLGYVFILLMSLTSNDRAVKRLGIRRWKILHSAGAYYLWFIFFFTYFGNATRHPLYFSITLVLVAGLSFKLLVKFRLVKS